MIEMGLKFKKSTLKLETDILKKFILKILCNISKHINFFFLNLFYFYVVLNKIEL
jgi:hypothetical protein